jgi:hypothetical protein
VIVAELPEYDDVIPMSSTSDYWKEDAQQKSSLTKGLVVDSLML